MTKYEMIEVIRAKYLEAKDLAEMSGDSLFPFKREAESAAKEYFADVAVMVEEVMA